MASGDASIQYAGESDVLCGVLPREQAAFEALPILSLSDGRRARILPLDGSSLPDNPRLLSGLDCLIFANDSTGNLEESQRAALTVWIENGGVLVGLLNPRISSTTDPLPADLLPERRTGSASVRALSNLSSFIGMPATPDEASAVADLQVGNGTSIISVEGRPLIVAGRRGTGVVFELAFNPRDPPFRSRPGLGTLWAYLLSHVPPSSSYPGTSRRPDGEQGRFPNAMLGARSGLPEQPARNFVILLVVFALIDGPIQFFVLRRALRLELVMVSMPVLNPVLIV